MSEKKKYGEWDYRYGLRVHDEYESDYYDAEIIDHESDQVLAQESFLKPEHLQTDATHALARKLREAQILGEDWDEVERIEQQLEELSLESTECADKEAIAWAHQLGWVVARKEDAEPYGDECWEWRLLYRKGGEKNE